MKRNHLNIFVIVFLIISMLSCLNSGKSEKYKKMQQFSVFVGEWEFEIDNGVFGERWEQKNDSVFSGYGYMVIGEDTVSREVLSVEQQGNDIFYIVIVEDHNDGQPVKFRLVSDADNTFVFENMEHDFPQKISYKIEGNDQIQAVVEGFIEGEPDKLELFYTRVKK